MKRIAIIAATLIASSALAGSLEVSTPTFGVSAVNCSTLEVDTYIDHSKTWTGSVLADDCEIYMYADSGYPAPDDAYMDVSASIPAIHREIEPCMVTKVSTEPTTVRLWCDQGQIFRNRFD